MIPTDFEGTNVVLGKPEGMTDEQCHSIKGKRGIDENNFPYTMVPDHNPFIGFNIMKAIYLTEKS